MTEDEKQRLNRKLAEWVGFREEEFGWFKKYSDPEPVTLIQRPHMGKLTGALNFTASLAACFKWLVPKSCMDALWIINNLNSPTPQVQYCFGFVRGKDNDLICWSRDVPTEECLSPVTDEPSWAICLSIDKWLAHNRRET